MKKIVKNGIKIEYDPRIPEEEVDISLENLKDRIINKQLQTIVLVFVKKKDGNYIKEEIRNDETITQLRRITGYLVGDLKRWNDGKKAEERDRVKHSTK